MQNDTTYHQIVDGLFEHIMTNIDDSELELDYECSGNVLTLFCIDNSQIVINKQEAFHQVWLAAKNGGYHFSYQDDHWIDDNNNTLLKTISQAVLAQGGELLTFQ